MTDNQAQDPVQDAEAKPQMDHGVVNPDNFIPGSLVSSEQDFMNKYNQLVAQTGMEISVKLEPVFDNNLQCYDLTKQKIVMSIVKKK